MQICWMCPTIEWAGLIVDRVTRLIAKMLVRMVTQTGTRQGERWLFVIWLSFVVTWWTTVAICLVF